MHLCEVKSIIAGGEMPIATVEEKNKGSCEGALDNSDRKGLLSLLEILLLMLLCRCEGRRDVSRSGSRSSGS